uniref:Replication factor C subunit 2 n=1 Tax=Aceria tosichella TaxID=561515 RepID=A0A6G1S7F3_9ACAR
MAWVERFRPKEFEDIVGNEEAVARLAQFAKEGNMPNIILHGPPGCGKTTVILCMARKILGPNIKEAVLELNASNERGIDVVRNKIKMFAQTKITLEPGKQKLVILDEADAMTEAAQQALRRIIEIYSKTTRFAFACNIFDKIIEPIQSRCAIVRFNRLNDEQLKRKLVDICNLMNVKYDDKGIQAVIYTAQGDMRQAINNLQSTHDGFEEITEDKVFKVCDEPPPIVIAKIIESCLKRRLDEAENTLAHLYSLGYCTEDIVSGMFRVVKSYNMPEFTKLEYLKQIGIAQIRVVQGVNSMLQMKGLISHFASLPVAV